MWPGWKRQELRPGRRPSRIFCRACWTALPRMRPMARTVSLSCGAEAITEGVIGIVASRVVERFGKPAIIVSVDENGEGKGTGRGVAGDSLYNAIAACGDLLIRFGGHALAAGLSVREEKPARVSARRSTRGPRRSTRGAQAPGAAGWTRRWRCPA